MIHRLPLGELRDFPLAALQMGPEFLTRIPGQGLERGFTHVYSICDSHTDKLWFLWA